MSGYWNTPSFNHLDMIIIALAGLLLGLSLFPMLEEIKRKFELRAYKQCPSERHKWKCCAGAGQHAEHFTLAIVSWDDTDKFTRMKTIEEHLYGNK